jgi:hypothetical protein
MQMTRNFICAQTEAVCEKPGCTRDTCIIEKQDAIRVREHQAQYWRPYSQEEVDDEMLALARTVLAPRYHKQHGRWPALDRRRLIFASRDLEEEAHELMRRHHDRYAALARDAIHKRNEWVQANPITDDELKSIGL